MKLRKLFAGIAASAVAVTSLAAVASANEAFLMYTDDSWLWGNWNASDFPAGTTDVTGDGTYTVYVDNTMESAMIEDEETGELVPVTAAGAMVFCVDIADLANDLDCGIMADGYKDCADSAAKMAFAKAAGLEISDIVITTYNTDGTTNDIAVDQSKIIYGDIEGNGKIRIEIQNEYGDTAKNPAIDKSTISFDEKIAVTFTVSGLDGAAAEDAAEDEEDAAVEEAPAAGDVDVAVEEDTAAEEEAAVEEEAPVVEEAPAAGDVQAATESSKGSPDTGIADVAAIAGLAVVAAGAVVLAKKSK